MHNHKWTRIITTFNSNNQKGVGVYICLCNASSIVFTEETFASSSVKVVHWCSNTLNWSWKDMSELVLIGNSPDSIFMHLVEEYVMRSCQYTAVKSHCKVVPHVYIGLYRWFVSLGCSWLMLYILGGVVCSVGLTRWLYLSICDIWICKFSYLHVCHNYLGWVYVNSFHIWNLCGVVGLCTWRFV